MLAQSSKAYFVLHNNAQKHIRLLLRDILVSPKHRRQAPPPRSRRVLSLQREPRLTRFFFTNEQRRIRHHITCSSSYLVYMIQHNKCNFKYIGETKRHLGNIFREYRRAIEKAITQ